MPLFLKKKQNRFNKMLLKDCVLGIKCELVSDRCDISHGETKISVNGREIFVRTENLELMRLAERFAVLGESPIILSNSGIISMIGPTLARNFLVKINSRGYLNEILVPEDSVLFRHDF